MRIPRLHIFTVTYDTDETTRKDVTWAIDILCSSMFFVLHELDAGSIKI